MRYYYSDDYFQHQKIDRIVKLYISTNKSIKKLKLPKKKECIIDDIVQEMANKSREIERDSILRRNQYES